jgi:hypothetical protein
VVLLIAERRTARLADHRAVHDSPNDGCQDVLHFALGEFDENFIVSAADSLTRYTA